MITGVANIDLHHSSNLLSDLPSSTSEASHSTSLIDELISSSDDDEYDSDILSDHESMMSTDGGVPVSVNAAYAEALNSEMDVVDADIMGPYNLAAVAADNSLSAFDSIDETMEDYSELPNHDAFSLSDIEAPVDENIFAGGEHHETAVPPTMLDAALQAAQQLQNIQDGQEQEQLAASTELHGVLQDPMEDQLNLPLVDFLENWAAGAIRYSSKKRKFRGPHLGAIRELPTTKPPQIQRGDLRGEECDFQGINWDRLEVTRKEARGARRRTYTNYTNLPMPQWHPLTLARSVIKNQERNYFKFLRMDFGHKINLSHFQLRNLVASTSRNNVFYAGESRVLLANPMYGLKAVRMNLSKPRVQPTHAVNWNGIQISTVAADHNILIAGGFCGEYGMVALDVPQSKHTEGLIIDDPNSITNHVQIQLNRQSGLPQAAIASNDRGVRILDCKINKFVAQHMYDFAINCSAVSPDYRLRTLVGDAKNVLICDAETGQVLQDLEGHVDYGFACAWADNGWHVATGNQDMLVKIWDARKWTDSKGVGKPIHNIAAQTAGIRSLRFSPLGSGKRVLVAAEPADIVSIIDAESYESTQTIDFFGEIAGVDFSPDGRNLFVGIHDSIKGGLMQFERCGFGQLYGQEELYYERPRIYNDEEEGRRNMATGFDWRRTTADVFDDGRSMRTATHKLRNAANLGDMDFL